MKGHVLEFWIDFVSPTSYFTLLEIKQVIALAEWPIDLRFRSLRIDPDAPADYEKSTIDVLREKMKITQGEAEDLLSPIVAQAKTLGLDFDFDRARGGNTLDAHRLLHFCPHDSTQLEVAELLFRAHFEKGKLMSERPVLQEVAEFAGFGAHEIARFLDSEELTDAVLQDESQAHERGIDSIPTLVINGNLTPLGETPVAQLIADLHRNTD